MKILTISNNDIDLDVREAGPEEGELVILLHGFPENWSTWRHQIEPLAQAGYRVCAPNMRGYGKSSKPKDVARYQLDELITDVDAIRRHYQREKFHLVGHDWGGAVAWWYAMHLEQNLSTLSILNLPHPRALVKVLRSNPKQLLKSWYMFFFQIPWLPEWGMARLNFSSFKNILKKSSNPGSYTDEDFRLLEESWKEPGTLRAMTNYYRAMMRRISAPMNNNQLEVPTRILWGENDLALSLEGAVNSKKYLKQGELITYPDATHWLAHDKPEEIVKRLLEHFQAHTVSTNKPI